MYLNILNNQQKKLLKLLHNFSNTFYLAGGTAIALQIGHRKSIDFDLFTANELQPEIILNHIKRIGYYIEYIFTQSIDELTLLVNNVKITFLSYPFKILTPIMLANLIKMPDLVTLASMKAYALGKRNKWKDYVDLYFLFKYHVTFDDVIDKAHSIFGKSFNQKLFREQLCYFDDLDLSEDIFYIKQPSHNIQKTIQNFLIDLATHDNLQI
jgi:hypothetical protein